MFFRMQRVINIVESKKQFGNNPRFEAELKKRYQRYTGNYEIGGHAIGRQIVHLAPELTPLFSLVY